MSAVDRKPTEGVSKTAKPVAVAVFGSRTLHDDRVRIVIMEALHRFQATKIVTAQEPVGVCEVGQRVAKELAIPLEVHFLNFRYLRGAFDKRSRAIVRASDCFIVVHDGVSHGTANELKLVKASKKPFAYEVLVPLPGNRNVGFNIEKDFSVEVTADPKKEGDDEESGQWD